MALIKKTKFVLVPLLILSLVSSGCVRYRPRPDDRSSFMGRVETQTQEGVTVKVTVLSNKESKRVFGTNLAKKGIQPVWVDIENQGESPYIFILRNMDPNYFSAEEAAYIAHYKQTRQLLGAGLLAIIFFPALLLIPFNMGAVYFANKKMDKIFNENSLHDYIVMPKQTVSGFVFTSVDQGTKHVKVDLMGTDDEKVFNFVVNVPGIKPDYTTKDIAARYPDRNVVEYTAEELPKVFERFPCCTTNKKGTKNGDPLNLIVIAEFEDLVPVFTAARWDETQALTFKSGFSMFKAFITGDNDRYSPISPLYYDDHSQDIAFQKTRDNINQRLHFRLWYTPYRYKSKPIWVGAISRDIGIRFTFKTWYLTTHKIDPNIDDSRDYLLADMVQAEKIAKYGFIKNDALAESKGPRKNLTGDPYATDDYMVVMELTPHDTKPAAFKWGALFEGDSK